MLRSNVLTVQGGEIDIIEGVNQNSANTFVLHTDTKCKVNGKGQTGKQALTDCAVDSAGTTGCGVNDVRSNSYGTLFNKGTGGYYVTEWQAEGIKIWFFPRGSEPASLLTSEPDTKDFGEPAASFQGDCDIEKRFMDQRFIFTNTFCGDWGGNVYAQSGCPMYEGMGGMASCKKYVAEHPALYKDAYWQVGSFKTYNKRAIVSSSSVAPSSTPHASSSSVRPSSSSVAVSSSSSAHVSSSSVAVSSSSAHASSSSVAHSSSVVSSSAVSSSAVSSSLVSSSVISSSAVSSSATPTPHQSSSAYPSTTPDVSSSSIHDVSTSASLSYSVTVSASASSSTPYDTVSSSSVPVDSSSIIVSSASETPIDHVSSSSLSPSASETPYSHDISSTISSVSASETPYSQDISASSSYPASSDVSSSPVAVSSDVSSIYPSETPYASSSVPASETPYDSSSVYPSGTSSSEYPDVTSSVPIDDKSSSSTGVYSTSEPIYSVYPEGDGYGHSSVSSKTPDASSKTFEYPTASSKVPDYGNGYESGYDSGYETYPTASSKTPEYDSYPTASSPAASSVKSTLSYDEYGLPSMTPLHSTYPQASSKPSHKTTDSYQTTTAYETTYVDVCSTGYTTITTKVTAIQTPAPRPTTDAYYAPPGFEVTTKYCAEGCGSGPKTVTVTVPCSKCQVTTPASNKPTDTPYKPVDNTPYVPGQPNKPATPEDQTTYLTATRIVTLTKIPVPESEYYATHPGNAAPSSIKTPDSGANKGYGNDKPVGGEKVYPTGSAPVAKPVAPTASNGKPVYPTAIGVPGSNVTISYGTATSVKSKPSQTGYTAPEFTGAASGLKVGGVVAGAMGVFAVFMM